MKNLIEQHYIVSNEAFQQIIVRYCLDIMMSQVSFQFHPARGGVTELPRGHLACTVTPIKVFFTCLNVFTYGFIILQWVTISIDNFQLLFNTHTSPFIIDLLSTLFNNVSKMKLLITVTAVLFSSAVAFTPSARTRTMTATSQSQQTILFAEPKDEEEGLDLNLEEMFDM